MQNTLKLHLEKRTIKTTDTFVYLNERQNTCSQSAYLNTSQAEDL